MITGTADVSCAHVFDELCVSTTSARARAVYTTPHSQHTDHHAVHALQLGKSVVCAVIDNSRQRGVARAAAEDDEEDDVMQPAAARDMASEQSGRRTADADEPQRRAAARHCHGLQRRRRRRRLRSRRQTRAAHTDASADTDNASGKISSNACTRSSSNDARS